MGRQIHTTPCILALLFLAISLTSCSSSKYSIVEDDEGNKMVVGQLTWEEWEKVAGWDSYIAADFTPNPKRINEIFEKTVENNISFYIFGGSWCKDSKSEMPKIYKVLSLAGVFPDKIILYGVDRDKREPQGIAESFDIQRVPTLIVMLNEETEIGRFIEFPKESWEDDIYKTIRDYFFKQKE